MTAPSSRRKTIATERSPVVRALRPGRRDYFVLKPRHSGFHGSALDTLLEHLSTRTLIVTGIAGDNCVLFTAADAHMRRYRLHVPEDCTISLEPEANRQALQLMQRELSIDITPAKDLDLAALTRQSRD